MNKNGAETVDMACIVIATVTKLVPFNKEGRSRGVNVLSEVISLPSSTLKIRRKLNFGFMADENNENYICEK